MKKFLFAAALMVSVAANAQIIDEFDTNQYGWTECSGHDGDAMILDGKMHIVGKKTGTSLFSALTGVSTGEPSFIETHCYAPIDVTKDFEISCDASIKNALYGGRFGLILDYYDEGNFIVFIVSSEGQATFLRYKEYRLVGRIKNNIKLKYQKETDVKLAVKNTYNKLQFYVNDMEALECRYVNLTSSGIGFFVYSRETVDFDNLVINQ
ncbi:MAG: hypothetical protein LUC49_04600 [Prevotella sp.]|nr:hypothetical protein [Prevotella sp.]MCD8305924.1 hypothetical protein [Prevotella sp.]